MISWLPLPDVSRNKEIEVEMPLVDVEFEFPRLSPLKPLSGSVSLCKSAPSWVLGAVVLSAVWLAEERAARRDFLLFRETFRFFFLSFGAVATPAGSSSALLQRRSFFLEPVWLSVVTGKGFHPR